MAARKSKPRSLKLAPQKTTDPSASMAARLVEILKLLEDPKIIDPFARKAARELLRKLLENP